MLLAMSPRYAEHNENKLTCWPKDDGGPKRKAIKPGEVDIIVNDGVQGHGDCGQEARSEER